jgi:hypothetical protein
LKSKSKKALRVVRELRLLREQEDVDDGSSAAAADDRTPGATWTKPEIEMGSERSKVNAGKFSSFILEAIIYAIELFLSRLISQKPLLLEEAIPNEVVRFHFALNCCFLYLKRKRKDDTER